MIKIIQNYTLQDIKDSMSYLLDKSSHSEEVRQLALKVIADKSDPIAAIYDFVKSTVSYVPDPVMGGDEIELFTSPVKMVRDYNQGLPLAEDCDGMALLATGLYRAIGIRANVIIIDSIGQGFAHAYCLVWSEKLGRFVSVDPSSDYPLGWELTYKEAIVV